MDNLKYYHKTYPSHQNALNLFEGEWSSKLPHEDFVAGSIPLFKDHRIHWTNQVLGGFQGKQVLELGPLEAGHSYMMEQLGASNILGIEANERAYLKCLIIKEILDLRRTKFLLGDAMAYLSNPSKRYDVCLASGVLYHMSEPIKMLSLLRTVAPTLVLWTHYYDQEPIKLIPVMNRRFGRAEQRHFDGHDYEIYKFKYKHARWKKGYRAGMQTFSYWMKKDEIISALKRFGFENIVIGSDEVNHPNGPSLLLVASSLDLASDNS